jgi:hypothetical protein
MGQVMGLGPGYQAPSGYPQYAPASSPHYGAPPGAPGYAHHNPYPSGPGPAGDQRQDPQSYYSTPQGAPITPTGYYASPGPGQMMGPANSMLQPQDPRSAPSGMFTRNLIGSLCVSAFKLTDPDGQLGVWFILQDLSVRTEGSFR